MLLKLKYTKSNKTKTNNFKMKKMLKKKDVNLKKKKKNAIETFILMKVTFIFNKLMIWLLIYFFCRFLIVLSRIQEKFVKDIKILKN